LRELALAVTQKGSQTLTGETVLSSAIEALNKADDSIEKSRLLFRMTADFVNLKNYERAFDALRSATTSMASLKREDFDDANKSPAPNSIFDYRNTFGRLGSIDFDRAMFLAQGIKWREFRLAAEIATCQSVLGKKG
jgi:putative heme iron utilization protein